MAPKSGQKATNQSRKSREEVKRQETEAAEKKRLEDEAWKDDGKGGKSKQEEKEEKRKAELARKAETARLLAEEEAATQKTAKAAATKAATWKKLTKPIEPTLNEPATVESYAASGIDNALDLLEVVTAKMDKASVGQKAADIESHPERRFKAAYEAYLQRELPNIKEERPGLRLQQYKDLLHKQFEKSPENPFNQTTVAYDAKKEEKLQVLQNKKAEVEERLREK